MGDLIITSSGGGGHLAVSGALSRECPGSKELSLLSEKGAAIWNRAQKRGDIGMQKLLVLLQPLSEYLWFPSIFFSVKNALLSEEELPNRVISTQPFHLLAMTSAMRVANWMRSTSGKKIEHLDIYLTDLPTKRAVHYLAALKRLRVLSPYAFSMVRVHFPFSTEGGQENLLAIGLKKEQLIDTPWKISPEYRDKNLPLPHQDTQIVLKNYREGVWEEFAKAGYNSSTFNIKKEDKVSLVMLGSVPEEKAVMDYVEEILASKKEGNLTGYFFVACGRASENIEGDTLKENSLYKKVCERIAKETPSNVKVIPFIGQPVTRILARTDLPLTRSGGATTEELIVLMEREGDDKKPLIHSPKKEMKGKNEEELREELLEEIPLWENGNARYLEKYHGATIVNPSLVGGAIRELLDPSFSV